MQTLTDQGHRLVKNAAARNGVSEEAALGVLMSLAAHAGGMAQFNHPDLGGMGQWSQGGMIMIGDMFNHGLKSRVDALCNDLAKGLREGSAFMAPADREGQTSHIAAPGNFVRWPEMLGTPSSTGSQNDLHYAVFPQSRRLALEEGGKMTIYDMGDHLITGFAQAQGDGQSITLTSQHGLVRLKNLAEVSNNRPVKSEVPAIQKAPPSPPQSDDEIFSRLEKLAALREKNIVTQEEFDAKKTELLARL